MVKDGSYDLPGVDVDMRHMRGITEILGFTPSNTVDVEGYDATVSNVRHSLYEIAQSSKADDRLLIYFSGYSGKVISSSTSSSKANSSNTTERVLVCADVRMACDDQSRCSHAGLLDIKSLLKTLGNSESHQVTLIIDSSYDWRTDDIKPRESNEAPPNLPDNVVLIEAPTYHRDELISAKSSPFTIAFKTVLETSQKNHQRIAITAEKIVTSINEHFKRMLPSDKQNQITIAGKNDLITQDWHLLNSVKGKPHWRALSQYVKENGGLKVEAYQSNYNLGEQIRLSIDSGVQWSGFLNLLTVDSNDQVSLLFPNPFMQDPSNNRVALTDGWLNIHSDLLEFDIRATVPLGKTMAVAILSEFPLNLYGKNIEALFNHGVFNPEVSADKERTTRVGSLTLTVRNPRMK